MRVVRFRTTVRPRLPPAGRFRATVRPGLPPTGGDGLQPPAPCSCRSIPPNLAHIVPANEKNTHTDRQKDGTTACILFLINTMQKRNFANGHREVGGRSRDVPSMTGGGQQGTRTRIAEESPCWAQCPPAVLTVHIHWATLTSLAFPLTSSKRSPKSSTLATGLQHRACFRDAIGARTTGRHLPPHLLGRSPFKPHHPPPPHLEQIH